MGIFSGRLMTCKNCGFQFRSSMEFESMWTTVQIDNKLIDFCPDCWGVPRKHWPQQVKDEFDKYQADKKAGKGDNDHDKH